MNPSPKRKRKHKMKINKDNWASAVKKAAEDLKPLGFKPSSNETCAIASVRYLRDALTSKAASKGGKLGVDEIKAEFSELIQDIQKEKTYGFGGNASAAAKTAGLESEKATSDKLLAE